MMILMEKRNCERTASFNVLDISYAFFFALFSVQYALHLYDYFKEWRKNRHYSFSCCLALFLPLVNLLGEIEGMVGTNLLSSQLQTGDFELTTVRAAVQDSGAFDVTLGEGEQADDHALDLQNDNRPVAKISNKKCHQGTQTEISSLLTVADFPAHETVKETPV